MKFVVAIALTSVLASPSVVLSQTTESQTDSAAESDNSTVSKCLGIQQDVQRLACYDTVFGYEPAPKDSEGRLSWMRENLTDDFTGKNTSLVYFDSDAPLNAEAPLRMYIRCDGSGSTDIFVVFGAYLGNDRLKVRYKFDDNEPVSESWMSSTDGNAVFLPANYRDFRAGLLEADEVLFEGQDFRGSRYRASFKGLQNNTTDRDYILGGCK